MRDGWREFAIAELADWRGGMTPSLSQPRFWESGMIPWISSKDVVGPELNDTDRKITSLALDATPLRISNPGAVAIVVRSGVLAHTFPVAYVPFATTVNQDIKIGQPRPIVDGRFLALLLKSLQRLVLTSYSKTGTTVQSVNVPALMAHRVCLPPLDEQRRIVDLAGALATTVATLRAEAQAAKQLAVARFGAGLGRVSTGTTSLGCYMDLMIDREPVVGSTSYDIVGVLNRGRGLLLRDPIIGTDTSYSYLHRVHPGQFVYSKLKAFEGAATVALEISRPAYASPEFPTFTMRSGAEPRFIRALTTLPSFTVEMAARSVGMGGRRERLAPAALLQVPVPEVALDDQRGLVEDLEAAERVGVELSTEARYLDSLQAAVLAELLAGERELSTHYDALLGEAA